MQIPVQDPVKEKFQKDLAELETLKQKAKTDKPKPVGSFLFQKIFHNLTITYSQPVCFRKYPTLDPL